MNRKHLHAALLLAAASVVATGAYAQNPNAAPQAKANAAEKGPDKAEKGPNKAEKGPDKADKKDEKADKKDDTKSVAEGKGKSVEERAARKAKEHDLQRHRLVGLKARVTEPIKQELRRHAERVARLERIKAVAEGEKDKDTVEKATKLIAKENERHDKWLEKHAAATPGAAPSEPAGGVK